MIPVVPKTFPNVTDQTNGPFKVKLKRWLGSRTITNVAWSADPSGPTFASQDNTIDTNTSTQVWITGFRSNTDYLIKGKVTASDGEIGEFRIPVKSLAARETE